MQNWLDPDVLEQVEEFIDGLPEYPTQPTRSIVDAIDYVAEGGPSVGRPIVGEISLVPDYREYADTFGHHLKEIRPLGTDIRILCTFTPDRRLVLLHAGNKAGDWKRWYRTAIPAAAEAYRKYREEVP